LAGKIILSILLGIAVLGLIGFSEDVFAADKNIDTQVVILENETIRCGLWNISEDGVLIIAIGVTLTLDCSFSNNAILLNKGQIINLGTIINNAGTIYNHGIINNGGTIIFNNESDLGVFSNLGSAIINNDGIIRLEGEHGIYNEGWIHNNDNGIIYNNSNDFLNKGFVSFTDESKFINYGGSTINNINNGVLRSYDGGEIKNIGTLNNRAYINIQNLGTFNSDGILRNYETITKFCGGIVNISGSFTGSAVIDDCPPDMEKKSLDGFLSDGKMVKVWTSQPIKDEMMNFLVQIGEKEDGVKGHYDQVNYDIKVTQNGNTVLDEKGNPRPGEKEAHRTQLDSSAPVDISITFQGYGSGKVTGPIGEKVLFPMVVPEFGTIAMMILAVAIISIVAVTAKSRVIPRL